MRPVIGFMGPIGCGKTTATKVLTAMGWERVRFAGPLKAMMRSLGCSEAEVDGALKETPSTLLGGKTPRYAMQTLGTEWGRNLIDKDLWINAWRHAVETLPADVGAVSDDVRFPNEADIIRRVGGLVVGIRREGHNAGTGHASEAFGFEPDQWIDNVDIDRFRYEVAGLGSFWKSLSDRDGA